MSSLRYDLTSLEFRPYNILPEFDDIDESMVQQPVIHSPIGMSRSSSRISSKDEGASSASALFHIVCVIAGTGILQLPYALKQSGWAGIFLMVGAALANDYTGRLLIQCLYYKGRRLTGYPEIGFQAYGRAGQLAVNVFYNSLLLGVTTLYLILSGMEFHDVVGILSKKQWIMICAVIVWLPFLFMRSLKEVTIVSLFGALASVGLVIIIIVLGVSDYPNHTSETHNFVNFTTLAPALGTIAFSFGGNFVYPEVEHSMKHPANFPKVLQRAMIVILAMYLLSGIIGYLTYGNSVQSPVLNSLPHGLISTMGSCIVTIHVLLACPVLVTTFSLDMERIFGIDNPVDSTGQMFYRGILRTITMIGVSITAMAVPYFGDFMTLLGSLSNTMLIFIFPILFHYKLFGSDGISNQEHALRMCIMAVGVFSGIVGGSQAIYALYIDFTSSE